jgi:hypothetical protein
MMFCTHCGAPRDDRATVCVHCNQPVPRFAAAPAIPNYLVQAVLAALFCCLPVGVVAIIYAAQVNSKLAAGDFAGARDASRKARMWSWITFGAGLTLALTYVVFFVVMVMQSP